MKLVLCVVTVGAVAILFGKVKGIEDDLEPSSPMTESLSELITENGRSIHTPMGVMKRFVGVDDAPLAPYMAMVIHDNAFLFEGSIISISWILIAAHNINQTLSYKVKTGSRLFRGGGTITDVSIQIIHEKFNHTTGEYDFGLLGLRDLLTFDDFTSNVKVSLHNVNYEHINVVHLYAFGCIDDFVLPTVLQQGRFDVITRSECQEAYQGITTITSNMFCISYGNQCSRVGDNGGPIMIPETNTQLGVLSFRSDSRPGLPAVIASISAVTDWITQKLQNHTDDLPSFQNYTDRETLI